MEYLTLRVIPSGFQVKNGTNQLQIEYENGGIMIQKIKPTPSPFNVEHKILAIFGIVPLIWDQYLLVVSDAEPIIELENQTIYKILSLRACNLTNRNPNSPEDDYFLKRIDAFVKTGFYYSRNLDLTNNHSSRVNLKNQEEKEKKKNENKFIELNYNCAANLKLLEAFERRGVGEEFIAYCIYGSIINVNFIKINDIMSQIIIISRRYIPHFGISFFRRGLGSEYVSDQIETEFILAQNSKILYSYIFLLGNLPCEYDRISNNQTRRYLQRFNDYIKNVLDEYKLVAFVHLLDNNEENKERNAACRKFFSDLKKSENKFKYYVFNTFEEKYEEFFQKNNFLINLLGAYIKSEHYYKEQKGLFSINGKTFEECNNFAAAFGWELLFRFLPKCQYEIPEFINPQNGIFLDHFKKHQVSKMEVTGLLLPAIERYSQVWQENLKKLKDQFHVKFDSENDAREYQRIIQLLFAPKKNITDYKPYLNKFKWLYSDRSTLKMFIGNWNTGAADLQKSNLDFSVWLTKNNNGVVPDMYIIGLEEVVELNTKNIIGLSSTEIEQITNIYEKKILDAIQGPSNQNTKYFKMCSLNLVGIILFVFCKLDNSRLLNKIQTSYIKTGLGGATGNKGSCVIRFNYRNTSFSIACSHLAAGLSSNTSRLQEILEILEFNPNKDKQSGISRSKTVVGEAGDDLPEKFQDSDIWFIVGDLNFRNDVDLDSIDRYINACDWNTLMKFDQLYKIRSALYGLDDLDEGEIHFQPTYKFDLGKNVYDKKKARNPSWCDRILFRKNGREEMIKVIDYNSVMDIGFSVSDHRPIYGHYEVQISQENVLKKKAFEKELKDNIKLKISSSYKKKFLRNRETNEDIKVEENKVEENKVEEVKTEETKTSV
ncbi:MAG: hypothetical protein MJ252_17980 [archaeon]|nr:hypothetical protein [archaeon]